MALQGFDKTYYLEQKLAALQATESEWVGKDIAFLETVLGNVYGLTAEEHYMQYGWQEGLAPNQYFNAEEYKLAKAQELFDGGNYLTVESALAAFEEAWQQDPYQHYIQYGAGESINPSNEFDASQYFADKLALLQASDPDTYGDWTADQVEAAFFEAGLTAVEHFMLYGQDEGLTVTVVPADEQVDSGTTTPTAGETFTLTADIDDIVGTAGNDTIKGVIDGTSTLTVLDSIDGGAGTDTLRIDDLTGGSSLPSGLTLASVETITVRAAGDVGAVAGAFDTSNFTEVTTLNVTQGEDVYVAAADTTAVNVSGVTGGDGGTGGTIGLIQVDGGSTQTVVAADGYDVTLGANTAASGDIALTHSDQGTGAIAIDGGADVVVEATSDATGTITVGSATAATGAVLVTQNLESDGAALTGGAVDVTGGTSVDVTVNATNAADAATDAGALAVGAIDVTSDGNTTDVAVVQNADNTIFTSPEVAEVAASSVVTFKALAKDETLTINGLTFTATKALTAEQAAAAFAGLTADDTQDAGGPTANGYYTGAFSTTAWTTGEADGATVTFTAAANNTVAPVIVGTATQVYTVGTAASGGVDSTNTVTYGAVTINEDATADASIQNISVDGYGNSTIGGTNNVDALKTLSLANSAGTMAVTTAAATLDLTVEDVQNNVTLTAVSLTDLDITTVGEDSAFALTAAAVTDLAIGGTADLDLSGSTLTALENVVVSGAAGLTLDASGANVVSVDASATTGDNVISVNATNATYTGGAGEDDVTLTTDTVSQAIDLGAGDDLLTVAAGTTAAKITATVAGGAGTDVVAMGFADAVAVSATADFDAKVTGFEALEITGVASGGTADTAENVIVDLENLTYNYVIANGSLIDADAPDTQSDTLVLDNMANNGTVELAADGFVTVNVLDAATGTADVLNVVVDGATVASTLTANDVETINIATDAASGGLNLAADSAETIVVSGEGDLDLTTDSAVLTLVDATALSGDLIASTNGTVAQTILGGAGDDILTANGSLQDVLNGGAGDDILVAGAGRSTLTGGDGADIFSVSTASTNVNSAATIADLESGDVIAFSGATAFSAVAIDLDDTAVFQDYANAAIVNSAVNEMAWFQFGDSTYVVMETSAVDAADSFVNGADLIVKIAGQVDLSTASFNGTDGTLEIA